MSEERPSLISRLGFGGGEEEEGKGQGLVLALIALILG